MATVLGNSLELLATYWACAKLGAAAVPLSPLLTATGLASLLGDAQPRVVVAATDTPRDGRRGPPERRRATADRLGADRRRAAGDGRGLPRVRRAARASVRGGARRARRGRRPADADVHVGHHRPAQGHPAHALHPRDVRADARLHVADGAGIGRAAHRRAGVQRGDDDDVPGVHARRDVHHAPAVRRRGVHRDGRARARHAHDAGALADHRHPQCAGLRRRPARVAADGAVARRAAAPRAQGSAEPAAAAPLLRALRPHRRLHHRARPRRRAAQGGQRRRAAALLRVAHRRRRRPRPARRAKPARSSGAGRSRCPATTAGPT